MIMAIMLYLYILIFLQIKYRDHMVKAATRFALVKMVEDATPNQGCAYVHQGLKVKTVKMAAQKVILLILP